MKRHDVMLTWDDQNGITNLSSSTLKSKLRRGDQVRFVANGPAAGTPLVVFLNGSPFSTVKRHWILGSRPQTVTRAAGSKKFKFLCAVIVKRTVRGGKGAQIPPIKPFP